MMNLNENIHRIKSLMSEDKEDSKREMIRSLGMSDAIKYFGNYYMIEPYLKVADKVIFIKEKVAEICDEIGDTSISLVELGEEPIHYDEEDGELSQLEYLDKTRVTICVYDEDMGSHLADYNLHYETLSTQIIEELVEILLNH